MDLDMANPAYKTKPTGAVRDFRIGRTTVRLKSGGLLVLGGGILLLVVGLIVGKIIIPSVKSQAIPANLAKPFDMKQIKQRKADAVAAASLILPDASTVTDHLQNSDFEGPFHAAPAPIRAQRAKISGSLANGWIDLSHFSEATVAYAQDKFRPQEGQACQRIEVKALTSGQVIFAQPVNLTKGKTYRWTLWLRASSPDTPVTASIRMRGSPYKYYGITPTRVGLDWEQVQVTGKITDTLYAYQFAMLEIKQPGVTLWVDSAHIEGKN